MTLGKPTVMLASNTTWSIYNFRAPLVRALVDAGCRVCVLAPVDSKAEALAALGCEIEDFRIDRAGTNPLRDWRTIQDFEQAYRRLRPNVVMHFTIKPVIYGGIACRRLQIPALHMITGLGTAFLGPRVLTRIVEILYRSALRDASAVVFLNAADRATFVTRGLISPQRAVQLPGEGIDTDYFASAPLPEQDQVGLRLLMVGRALRDKGLGEFVEAARRLRDHPSRPHFQLIGPAEVSNRSSYSRAEVEAWVREGVLEYLGAVDDIRPALRQAHAVVLPSYREGLSRSLIEAAAIGRPLIATDVPGCRELIRNGVNGFLCEPRNSADLARALLEFCSLNRGERIAMGEASRRMAMQTYSCSQTVPPVLQLISEALGRSTGTSACQLVTAP